MSALRIEGEFSIYRAAELKGELLAAVASSDAPALDLSQVEEMDSAGLQLLLLARREAAAAGKELQIRAGSPAVAEVLGLCGIRFDACEAAT